MSTTSRLDAIFRSILLTKFFTKGWGKPENLRRLFEFRKIVANRDECFKLIERDYPVTITKEQKLSDCRLVEGHFMSPLEKFLPGIVPKEAQLAHFQAIFPLQWTDPNAKPVCLHLAGTGDHYFWRRRNLMVKPLLKEAGIGGIILENPFYGTRKPINQVRSSLHNVSDIFVMGGCLILEALVLFHWCERNGYGPLGVTGLSMGGHMASLAATNWPKPLVLVPCLSWSTASAVFLQGVMSQSINWDLLEDQYLSDGAYKEKLSKMVTIVDEAFLAGKRFARTFTENVETKPITLKENIVSEIKMKSTVMNDLNKSKALNGDECKVTYGDLHEELKRLLEEGKMDDALYDKLISNVKFQLTAKDIENLNKLSEEEIKEFLFKFKIVELQNEIANTEPEPIKTNELKLEQENINQAKKIILDKKPATWGVANLWTTLSTRLRSEKKIDISKIHWRDRETLQFMRGIMDECTHLSNFSVPYDTSLIIAVCAKHDAYVPREDVGTLEEIWPGAEVRYVDAGHVSAYILHQSLFRNCIIEAFDRSKRRWKDGRHDVY